MRTLLLSVLLLLCSVFPAFSQVVLPFFEGFEAAGPTTTLSANANPINGLSGTGYAWKYEKTSIGRLRFQAGAAYPATGVAAATLDCSAVLTPASINYLTLEMNMANYIGSYNLALEFKYAQHGDEQHPNDKVWIRGDSLATWIEVYDLWANRNTTAGAYKTVNLNLSSALASAGQALSPTFQIRFGQEDDNPSTSVTVSDGYSFDDISVTGTPPAATDAGIAGFPAFLPNACSLGIAQQVQVTVKNFGTSTQTSIPVYYQVNGVTYGPETFTGSLAQGATAPFTFTQTVNMSALGAYSIKAWTGLAGDGVAVNDTASTTVNHYNGLNGTFTINNLAATGGTNYASFQAAASDLAAQGICGPVLLNVLNGPYNEQVTLGAVTGSSATNTITFDGGTGVKPELTFGTTTTNDRHVFKLSAARYVTLRNLKIVNTNSATSSNWGFGVHLVNGASNNTVENCFIQVDTVQTSSNYAGVVIAGGSGTGVTATSTTGTNSFNAVRNNTIRGGYYGITSAGATAPGVNYGTVISGNTLELPYFYGIYLSNNSGALVEGNSILNRTTGTTTYGIYSTTTVGTTVTRNQVLNSKVYGIYFTGLNAITTLPADTAYVTNNFIATNYTGTSATNGGLYLTGTINNLNVWHNSFYTEGNVGNCMNSAAGTASAGIDIRNNAFVQANGTTGFALTVTNAATLASLDYNNYHGPTLTNLISVGGTTYTASNLVGGGGYNTNAKVGNPFYDAPPADLHTSNGWLWNAGTNVGISTDFDGDVRPLGLPAGYDIGADEFLPASVDGGISGLVGPVNGCGLGAATDLVIRISNYGQDSIKTFSIGYSINGGPAVLLPVSDTLLPAVSDTITLAGALNLAVPGTYTIKFWTAIIGDLNAANDTAVYTVIHYNGLNGTYTIDNLSATGGTNYASFTAATADLMARGVCGPVVLNVLNGPYNEQVTLGDVINTSAVNTITFEGGTGVKPTLTFGVTTTNDRQTLKLNGSGWVRIRNLKIENTNSSTTAPNWGFGVHLVNGAHDNIVENCLIVVDSVQTSTNYAAVAISGGSGTAVTSTTVGYNPNNTIRNNVIRGGYYGVSVAGGTAPAYNQGTVVSGNDITGSYFGGVRIANCLSPLVEQNNITLRPSTATTAYGIFSTGIAGGMYARNKVLESRFAGIYFTTTNSVTTVPASPVTVVNNFVSCDYTLTSALNGAIYLTGTVNDVRIWNNSTYATGTIANGMRNNAGTTSTGIDIRNNSFMTEGTTGMAFMVTNLTSQAKLDYNNYYAPQSSSLIDLDGTVYNGTTMIGAGGFNTHSTEGNPVYLLPPTDLHTIATQLWNTGTDSLGVVIDFDGDVRPLGTMPGIDIGADEFTPASKDIGVAGILSPTTGCGLSFEDLSFEVENFGNDTIFAFNVTYTLNGVPVTQAITDTVAPGAVYGVIFPATLNLVTPGQYTIGVSVSTANDANLLNDTSGVVVYSIPNVNTFPYFQGFDAGFGGWTPGGTLSSWEVGTPAKATFSAAASAPNCWTTNLTGPYNNNEKSWVISPCMDFTSLVQPVIELDVWWECEFSNDGMVLQSSIDGGLTWQNVGAAGDPDNWYNDAAIGGLNGVGGGTGTAQDGWTGLTTNSSQGWRTAKHLLDGLGGQSNVRLRMAFGSTASLNAYGGVGFDNVFIYETPNTDVGVTRFLAPTSDCGNTATAVIVEIKNFGLVSQSNIPVTASYAIAGGGTGMITTIFAGPVAPGTLDTVLIGTINTTAGGDYTFTGYTGLGGDAIAQNDSAAYGTIALGEIPVAPTAADMFSCVPDTFTLIATNPAGITHRWYDAATGGNLIHTGDSLEVFAAATTTYYVEANEASPSQVGPLNPASVGTGGNYTFYTDGLLLNTTTTIILDSVTVYPNTSGNVVMNLMDAASTVITSVTIPVVVTTAGGPIRVAVGMTIPAGTGWQLDAAGTTTGLYRNTAGAVYPYNDPLGTVSITGPINALAGFYYFFYDWAITTEGCPSARTPVVAGIYPKPVVSLGADQFICDSAVLTVAGFPTVVFNDTVFSNSLTVSATGSYRVTVTDGNGCVASDTIFIQQNPSPVVNLGNDTSACGSLTLNGTGQPGNSYTWFTPSGTSFNPSLTAVLSGQYALTVTNAFGCSGQDTLVLTIHPNPTVTLGNDVSTCTPVTLTASTAATATYLWNTGATTGTLQAGTLGTNMYSVTITDANGCTDSDTVVVTLVSPPVVSLGNDTTVCAPITLSAGNPGSTYQWSTPGGNATQQSVQAGISGTYTATVTNSIGCTGTDDIVVTLAPQTVGGFTSVPVAGNSQLIQFTSTSTGANLAYFWDFGDTKVANDTSSLANPTFGYATPDFYEITLIVKGLCGSDTVKTAILVDYNSTPAAFEQGVKLFPNPTAGRVMISSDRAASLHVYDALGRPLHQLSLHPDESQTVDLSSEAAGVYLFRFNDGATEVTRRVVVH